MNLTQFQECRNQEFFPDSGDVKPEPQARDKAASIIGNTNARYVQDAKKIERVLAEEAKERQGERNDLKVVENSNIVEKIPQSEPESKSREKAASIIGNTNARYG